jgi:alkylated DNA repair protein alkB homolog 6
MGLIKSQEVCSLYHLIEMVQCILTKHIIHLGYRIGVRRQAAAKRTYLDANNHSIWRLTGGTPKVEDGKMLQEPIPTWLKEPIFKKLQSIGVNFGDSPSTPTEPNHILVNEYLPGQGIMPHQDGPLYNPIVATVTLNSHSVLNFYPHGVETATSEPKFSVLLEPRSLFVQTGQLYKTYLHGIAEVTADDLAERSPINYDPIPNGTELPRHTRFSLTYRHVKRAIKNPFAKTLFKH